MTTDLMNFLLEVDLALPVISELEPSGKGLLQLLAGQVSSRPVDWQSSMYALPVEGGLAATEVRPKRANSQAELESLKLLGAGIAHDLGNVLTVLAGNLELARFSYKQAQAETESELRYSLEKLEGAVNMAKALHNQLHQLFQGTTLVKESVALPELLEEATRLGLFGAVGVECRFRMTGLLPLIRVERCQISQVIENLVLNAVQAMPHGGQLEVAAEVVELAEGQVAPLKSGKYIEITVSDTGTGIAPQHLSMIFAPHFTTKAKGQGLGLALCYSIIQRHRGNIRVESQPGSGTTFRVWLPLRETELE